MMEEILKIEEVSDLQLSNTGVRGGAGSLGLSQMLSCLCGYAQYDGFKISTSEHEYLILIDNGQNCCEQWGYFSSEDNFEDFVGKNLFSVELTDTALNKKKLEELLPYGPYEGGIQFVDFKMTDGSVLQFAVYNAHNGYYGHPIIVAKDGEILLNDAL